MIRIADYRPRLSLSIAVIGRTWGYSAANYFANLLNPRAAVCYPSSSAGCVRTTPSRSLLHCLSSCESFVCSGFCRLTVASGGGFASRCGSFSSHTTVCESLDSDLSAQRGHRGCDRSLALVPFGPAYAHDVSGTLAVLALSAPSVAFCSVATMVLRITQAAPRGRCRKCGLRGTDNHADPVVRSPWTTLGCPGMARWQHGHGCPSRGFCRAWAASQTIRRVIAGGQPDCALSSA